MWDFPGGHIEDGESAGEALARELLEEVAVSIVPPRNAPTFRVQDTQNSPERVDALRLGVGDVGRRSYERGHR